MTDIVSSSGVAAGGLDLTQFHQAFFDEAAENLERFEQEVLGLDPAAADDEALNAIFRCAHSVKGGAAAFGFADVAELTHEMETLLDQLRRHERALAAPMVDVLLRAGDALRTQLERHQEGGATPPPDVSAILCELRAWVAAPATPMAAPVTATLVAPANMEVEGANAPPAAAGVAAVHELVLVLAPDVDASGIAGIEELFREVVGLGTLEQVDAADAHRFRVRTATPQDELLDLLAFHVSRDAVSLESVPASAAAVPPVAQPRTHGFFAGAPGAPDSDAASLPSTARAATDAAPREATAKTAEAATLRVSIDKVDQLINLVGELVITQAMLSQTSARLDGLAYQRLAAGLADLNRNTRDLQESVMSIRMIPMSVVFNRFPRMLRDLAGKLGKKVELATHGEATELDKGLVEKLLDPLTHLVRNSCDHGIETPADRVAHGKPEAGVLTLSAAHQGGSIVIEVRDDGRGLSRPRLLAKARERGIDAPDSLTDGEVWNLIFAPGFSTAEAVTDVSGRGVGMDVVKRNITALGGTVDIESTEGAGMSVKVRLPLTLAIMDGMSVAIGEECYILPLASVVESFQVRADTVQTIGGNGRVVRVRGEYLPVVVLEEVFGVPPVNDGARGAVMVLVEADGRRCALLVDRLIGQQQVVVKNLEANYRRVTDVSGATIMGDGRVALILDVASLARRSRH